MREIIINLLHKFKLLIFIQFVRSIFAIFAYYWRSSKIHIEWRYRNQHNQTFVVNENKLKLFPLDKVSVGKYSYGPLCVHSFGSDGEELIIGNYCSISLGVKFILGGNHVLNAFSTFPFNLITNNDECEALTKGPVIVEDDVWIGTGALILSGVRLAKGTVVAAGSIVTKSTAPYSIVGGNPAKLIRKRFDDEIIKSLLDIDLNSINLKEISALLPKLKIPLNIKVLNEIKSELLQN